MKYRVIFLEGLSLDELKALDAFGLALNKANRADFFSRFADLQAEGRGARAVALDSTGRASAAPARDWATALRDYPEKYVKVIPQFEVKLEVKLQLPFPEEIVENGRRYRLVVE